MPWLDPKAKSVEDATGAGVEDNISTSVLLVVPGPRTTGGPSDKGQLCKLNVVNGLNEQIKLLVLEEVDI
jgi:hypothetical protein